MCLTFLRLRVVFSESDKNVKKVKISKLNLRPSFKLSNLDKPKGGLEELLNCYPQVKNEAYESNSRKPAFDITNRYFLMFQDSVPQKDKKGIAEERKWRKWVDDTLVHTLSPNVYRSPSEALQAFQWFDKAGDWEKHFKTWERFVLLKYLFYRF